MSAERVLLLPEEDQLNLTLFLHDQGMFGIHEDPTDFITLKSKRVSPHYLDARKGISEYESRQLVANTFIDLAEIRVDPNRDKPLSAKYDHIAGTPEAVTSYIPSMADNYEISLLQPRVDIGKSSGNKSPILGRFNQGDRVAMFDDVVTDGKSKIDTIGGLATAGLVVADYFVLVDREEGGSPQVLAETGIEIIPALAVSSMALMLSAEGRISQTQFDNVSQYLAQYGDPSAKAALGTAA
jgi:orotate phosphoribosyltransferase